MFSQSLPAAAALLSALSLVSAQTFTDCNPLQKTCPSDAALGTTITTDFTKGPSDDWNYADGTKMEYSSTYGAEFYVNKSTDAPVVISNKYIMFGKVSVLARAAPGQGIVSSFILESDDLDEVDWEWLGSTDSSVESNFFGKGNTTTYDRAIYHPVGTPIETFRTYTIDWTKDYIKWLIDGVEVRTLNYNDPKTNGGTNFPQTPMRVRMGNWVGCASVAAETDPKTQGTCQWAGGHATFPGVYPFYVKTVTVQDYSCAESYTYGDNSGSWQSIKMDGSCNGTHTSGSSTTSSVGSSSTGAVLVQSSSVSGTAGATTTLSTATSAATAKTTGSATTSSGPAQQSTSGASKHEFGVIDFTVVALGLGLGYLVM